MVVYKESGKVTQGHIMATGGLGYIGSHTAVQLIEAGYQVSIIDNLSNSSLEVLNRIEELSGSRPTLYQGDIRDQQFMHKVFSSANVDAVIHYAGLKAVGESCEKPELYYDVNVAGTLRLLEAMQAHGVNQIVFSSSATVYGEPEYLPLDEQAPLRPASPYGHTKRVVEQLLESVAEAHPEMACAILRYFNPIGAHPSGRIGEDPRDIPNNLMPFITQVAVGKRDRLSVWGDDYDTPDGTGVRDYIHVVDLATAHLKALEYINQQPGYHVWNIGVGRGYSVLDVVNSFKTINGVDIPYQIQPRRSGDVESCYANPEKAAREIGWTAQFGIDEMVRDSWNWQKNNPDGYEE